MELRQTKDGSYTLYIPELDEHYHSFHGARTESEHVFIKHGLKYCQQHAKGPIRVFEMGLGTGYNALLTFLETIDSQCVEYHTVEKYPVPLTVLEQLAEADAFLAKNRDAYLKLMHCDWETRVDITPNFSLKKWEQAFEDYQATEAFDLIYYDAFGFRAQDEMWQEQHYQKLANMLVSGGYLVTYAAKGIIRRGFESAGLSSERLPGPPGKREMLRLRKP